MEKLNEFRYIITMLFQSLLKDEITEEILINKLRELETEIIEDTGKHDLSGLWFKFSYDDTGATTINDMRSDFKGTKRNRDYLFDRMKGSVKDNSLKVYFS